MSDVVILDRVELIPVVELEPTKFATDDRMSPATSEQEEWVRYWSDALADSGIRELQPLRRGSWYVPTVNFDVSNNLQRFLERTFQSWDGIDTLSDPDCNPVLDGGLALRLSAEEVLVEPGCCADLGDANNWQDAAKYRGAEWQVLWIGHPWVSVRYQDPWLVVSDRHESSAPQDRWCVHPDELRRALEVAMIDLKRFAEHVAKLLPLLGYRGDSAMMGRKLAGLSG